MLLRNHGASSGRSHTTLTDAASARTGSSLPSRRAFLGLAALGAAATVIPLSGCSTPASATTTTIRFFQNKPEVTGYFADLVAAFNAAQSRIRVIHDSTPTSLVAQIVRGAPPDLACYSYNLETSTYVERGVLSDLAELPEATRVRPDVQALVDQFATYRGQTNVLPYSVTAAGVIYNQTLFAENNIEVPTTFFELISACERFLSAGITPIYLTAKDLWTLSQGLFDYSIGGAVDVAEFFQRLRNEGANILPSSTTSFANSLAGPVDRMLQLVPFSNPDAAARTYADGNLAFGRGEAAMYFQGPWALGEIAKVEPDFDIGTFALPMTDSASDRKVRVNLDLSLWIPQASTKKSAARQFLSYLMQPEIIAAYNTDNLAYSPLTNAAPQTDSRVAELQPYIDESSFYQGAGTYIPPTIPLGNYLQQAVLSGNGTEFLRTLDADWRRLAARTS